MKGKILKNSVIAIWLSLGLCVGLTSCSSDGDGTIGISPLDIENYLYGKRWFFHRYFMDKTDTQYSFFRNHLVMSFSSVDKVVSGMLTYDNVYYFGTWNTAGDKLLTTFTVGTHKEPNIKNLLYGTLTVTDLASNVDRVTCTDSIGETHYFEHTEEYLSKKRTFTDYTDACAHDKALHGTWKMTAYRGNTTVHFTITVNKKGYVRFVAESEGVDFTTTYTTKNGHVTFTHFLHPNTQQHSFIYVRNDDSIEFFSEENAQRGWVWLKK